jgi:hypothetical protein
VVYKNREGDCLVPLSHKENGFMLGQWVDRRRQTKSTMPLERRRQLEKIGFVWNPLDASWEEGFGYLKSFQKRESQCRVVIKKAIFRLVSGYPFSEQTRIKCRQIAEVD